MIDSLAIRSSPFGLCHVRHSNFVIRHCPAPHDATGQFNFELRDSNLELRNGPPFNVNAVDKERLKEVLGT